MKAAATVQRKHNEVCSKLQEQLTEMLRHSEYRRRLEAENVVALNVAMKKAQGSARSSERCLLKTEAALHAASDGAKMLKMRAVHQKSLIRDLRCQVADLKENVRAAKAEATHWRKFAMDSEVQRKAEVAAAELRADRAIARVQQHAQYNAEDRQKSATRDASHIDCLKEKLAQEQTVSRLARKRVAQLEASMEAEQVNKRKAQRSKSHHKKQLAVANSAAASERDARHALEAELLTCTKRAAELQAEIDLLRERLDEAQDERDNGRALSLLKTGSTRQFNDRALELTRSLLLLGIAVEKVAPIMSGFLDCLNVPVDKRPTISLARKAMGQSKVLVAVHAHDRMSNAEPQATRVFGHDASNKGEGR